MHSFFTKTHFKVLLIVAFFINFSLFFLKVNASIYFCLFFILNISLYLIVAIGKQRQYNLENYLSSIKENLNVNSYIGRYIDFGIRTYSGKGSDLDVFFLDMRLRRECKIPMSVRVIKFLFYRVYISNQKIGFKGNFFWKANKETMQSYLEKLTKIADYLERSF